MFNLNDKFKKDYPINIYDVDTNLKCKFSSILNYLWDIVISQSDALGETDQGLVHNNCAWILLKYDINIYEYPKYKETISVDTKVLGVKKFYGYRENTISNSEGKIIGEVISIAILIDIEKRRPMKIYPDQYEIYGINGELEEDIPLDDILKLEKEDYSRDYLIRHSDIDSNNHVNNAKYIEMCVDTLPRELVLEYELSNVKVLFKKETTYGDKVHVSTQVINNEGNQITTVHKIVSRDEKLLTKLQLEWRNI